MYRYFTHDRTYHYLDFLSDIVKGYYARPHSALNGNAPNDITDKNQAKVWKQLYIDSMKKKSVKRKKKYSPKPFKFKLNDFVRISSNRRTFQRDFEQKWMEEIFVISARYLRQGIPIYKISRLRRRPKRRFYAKGTKV